MIAAFAVSAVLVVTPVASAAIVVNQSVDGVRLGDRAKTVQHKLGKPNSNHTCNRFSGMSPCGPAVRFWYYADRTLTVFLLHGRVQELDTASKTERTASGIGPGIRMSLVKRLYPHGSTGTLGSSIYGYFFAGFPKHNGDVFTAAFIAGNVKNKVADVLIGRWDSRYACDFFACQ
jgi:hypothetical protein